MEVGFGEVQVDAGPEDVRRVGTVGIEVRGQDVARLPLLLGVQVLIPKPWKLTAYLMIYDQHLRRLDVNGNVPSRG